jgi:hypothetical protein
MYKTSSCGAFALTLCLSVWVSAVVREQAERKCHNYYNTHNTEVCRIIPKTYNYCRFCVLKDGDNFTICNIYESAFSVEAITHRRYTSTSYQL